jgi:hypothetical protein
LPVYRRRWDDIRQSGGEDRVPSNRTGLLAYLADTPHDNVFDDSRIYPGSIDERIENEAAKITGVPISETSTPTPPGRPDGSHDISLSGQRQYPTRNGI